MIDLISVWSDVPAGANGCKSVLNVAPGGFGIGDARLPSIPMTLDALGALKKNLTAWCHAAKDLFDSSKMCGF